jgi:hypothetical protein
MKANEFDKKFDSGADIISSLDLSKAKRPMLDQKRVNVDFPIWTIESMDREANRLGVTRQSIIKICWQNALSKLTVKLGLPHRS